MKTIPGKKETTRLTLRLPASLYDALKTASAEDGLPLNTYCLYILSRHDICKSYKNVSKKKTKKDLTL
jgi:predicted DNA binding CopG/RHH family protein